MIVYDLGTRWTATLVTTRGKLIKQAFEEFRVTRQVSTGNGALYCAMTEFGGRAPGWFVRQELGYDGPCGARLYAMIPQDVIEARHKQAARPRPMSKSQIKKALKAAKRENKYSRRLKLEQLEMQARAAQYAI